MADITDDHLELANPILERYREQLFSTGSFIASSLERDLKELWGGNWQTLKPRMKTLLNHGRYQEVAAYYMERSNPTGPAAEFKLALLELYGVKHEGNKDFAEKKAAYWKRALNRDEPVA